MNENNTALEKYMNNEPLTLSDIWDMLQMELYSVTEEKNAIGDDIVHLVKDDMYSDGYLDGSEKYIRYAMDLIQKIK